MKRTEKEISLAVIALRENKNNCRLGQDAYSEINAKIQTIRNNWDMESIDDNFVNGSNEHLAAIEAHDYMNKLTGMELSDLLFPE